MKHFPPLGAVALLLVALTSFAWTGDPVPPARTTGPLKFSDLTLDRARRFEVVMPLTLTIPPQTAFVVTEASAPQGAGDLTVNGITVTAFGQATRKYDPPVVLHAGDVVTIGGGTGVSAIIAGYIAAESEVTGGAPANPVPLKLHEFALDRARRIPIFFPQTTWSLTVPAAGLTVVLAEWTPFPSGGPWGPIAWSVDGTLVGTTPNVLAPFRFDPPIIVQPGQTLTATLGFAGNFTGDFGGYIAYPGET
jgi:hypothetical protein